MFYLFLFMFLLSSKLPPVSGCTKVLPSSPAFPLPEVPLTPTESDSHRPLFLWIKEVGQNRMGHQLPHCRKHMGERDCWHTSCTADGADTGSEFPNHTRAGVSCMQIHPIILHSKAMASLFEFTFFTIYKYLFSFPHKICMTGPARACILQVKPG